MQIRLATIHDAPKIAQIHVETWCAAYRGQMPDEVLDALSVEKRLQLWQSRTSSGIGKVFVAEVDHELIGFCDLIPSRDQGADATVGEIVGLYILSAYWRKGIGQALFKKALTEANDAGYKKVTLWVLAANARAIQFYKAVGFAADGTSKIEKMAHVEMEELRFSIGVNHKSDVLAKTLYAEIMRRFPEIRGEVHESDDENPYMLMNYVAWWMEKLSDKELTPEIIDRLVKFGKWCGEQPRGDNASHDIVTIWVVAFYEKLFECETGRKILPNFVTREDIIRNEAYLKTWVGKENYAKALLSYGD